jgi:hypothetical protein
MEQWWTKDWQGEIKETWKTCVSTAASQLSETQSASQPAINTRTKSDKASMKTPYYYSPNTMYWLEL